MTAKEIQKYNNKSIPQLIKLATIHFNKYIRQRDKRCISCNAPTENAGHYFSAGNHASLRFDERNVHGQCIRCNKWLHGNLIEYRKGLVKKIGLPSLEIIECWQDKNFKWDRFTLIDLIITYKAKCI